MVDKKSGVKKSRGKKIKKLKIKVGVQKKSGGKYHQKVNKKSGGENKILGYKIQKNKDRGTCLLGVKTSCG